MMEIFNQGLLNDCWALPNLAHREAQFALPASIERACQVVSAPHHSQ